MIEHVVLFNVKDDADPAAVNAWIDGLNSLSSLDEVIHLTAGPVLRTRSLPDDDEEEADGNLRFTHMLHARYASMSELESYSAHPAHQRVVNELGKPIIDDLIALDWATSAVDGDDYNDPKPSKGNSSLHPGPGRALRLTCFKFREEEEEKGKRKSIEEVLEGWKRIQDEYCSGMFQHMSFGEEISVDRAKGYSVAAIVTFSDLNELDACEEYEDAMRKIMDRAKNSVDWIIAVDYVVPRR